MVILKLVLVLLLQSITVIRRKLTSNAIRVPVPNGSLVVLNLQVKQKNFYFSYQCYYEKICFEGELVEQIKIFYE
jgi:glyceraldehyde 3-phosphate dehydrogenase